MARRIIICKECGEERELCANGLCRRCYGRLYARDWRAANASHFRAQSRAYWRANRDHILAKNRARRARTRNLRTLRRRLAGRGARTSRGHLSHAWTGGRLVYCAICGAPASWKAPCQLQANTRGFLCRAHAQRSLMRHGATVYCGICGQALGHYPASKLAKIKSFPRCFRHRCTKNKEPYYDYRTGSPLRSAVA